MNKLKFLVVAVLAVFLSACTSSAEAKKVEKPKTQQKQTALLEKKQTQSPLYKVNGRHYSTKSSGANHYEKRGKASYYHNKFNGRRTANGEVFNNKNMTAAHRTLPMGTYVLVTNLRNNRKVVVRINDRGPYIQPRIIDLSRAAAAEIGMINSGIAHVKVEKLHLVSR